MLPLVYIYNLLKEVTNNLKYFLYTLNNFLRIFGFKIGCYNI